jgi:hypothetical protein
MCKLNRGEQLPKTVDYFCQFKKTARSKLSPDGLKFVQSGHPEANLKAHVVRCKK